MNVRRLRTVAIAAGFCVALSACGSDSQPGNKAVYDRIASTTDCDQLQQEFDAASSNHDRAASGSEQAEAATGYMKAADERMQELACY